MSLFTYNAVYFYPEWILISYTISLDIQHLLWVCPQNKRNEVWHRALLKYHIRLLKVERVVMWLQKYEFVQCRTSRPKLRRDKHLQICTYKYRPSTATNLCHQIYSIVNFIIKKTKQHTPPLLSDCTVGRSRFSWINRSAKLSRILIKFSLNNSI